MRIGRVCHVAHACTAGGRLIVSFPAADGSSAVGRVTLRLPPSASSTLARHDSRRRVQGADATLYFVPMPAWRVAFHAARRLRLEAWLAATRILKTSGQRAFARQRAFAANQALSR